MSLYLKNIRLNEMCDRYNEHLCISNTQANIMSFYVCQIHELIIK